MANIADFNLWAIWPPPASLGLISKIDEDPNKSSYLRVLSTFQKYRLFLTTVLLDTLVTETNKYLHQHNKIGLKIDEIGVKNFQLPLQ